MVKKQGWLALVDRIREANPSINIGSFSKYNFPDEKYESWHFTSLLSLNKILWRKAKRIDYKKIKDIIDTLELPEHESLLAICNGYEEVKFSKLSQLISKTITINKNKNEQDYDADLFSENLNYCLNQEEINLNLNQNTDAGLIILLNIHNGNEYSTHNRININLARGAKLKILNINYGEGVYLNNPVFNITCHKGSELTFLTHQKESIESYSLRFEKVLLHEDAKYKHFYLNQGGTLARDNIICDLVGKSAKVDIAALLVAKNKQKNDLTVCVNHFVKDCLSKQNVRSLISDQAIGIFQGKIFVDKIAQHTDGGQINKAILLSDEARFYTKPELEIFADDIKCNHGATIGALDENALFFLRSRGIPEKEARMILIDAFSQDVISFIEDDSLNNYFNNAFKKGSSNI